MMKTAVGIARSLIPLFTTLSIGSGVALAQDPPFDWTGLAALIHRCSELPYALTEDGQTVLKNSRSICPNELVVSGTLPRAQIRFLLNGLNYVAYAIPSPLADGNDLMDLTIYQVEDLFTYTLVARQEGVLGFGDALTTLALGNTELMTKIFVGNSVKKSSRARSKRRHSAHPDSNSN